MPVQATDLELLRRLFFYRKDVHAEMFKYKTGPRGDAGKIGYSPACARRWEVGICNNGKCRQCQNFAPITLDDSRVMDHLKGKKTLGTYLVSPQGMVNLCVLDVDIDKAKSEHIDLYRERVQALAGQLYRITAHQGLPVYIEDSGNKGYHLWIFFEMPIPAGRAQALGAWLANQADYYEGLHVEVFPKQDAIDQYGNLVKVPLGVHLKTGRRCLFVDPETFTGQMNEQLDRLRTIETISLETLEFLFGEHEISVPTAARSNGKNGAGAKPGGLPCLPKMYVGVSEGCRDEVAFRLAVHHFRQGRPKELAELDLCRWDADHNDPPIGESLILEKVASAYTGKYSYGCSNPLIESFCDPSCPIYKKRQEPEPAVEEEVRSSSKLRFLKIDPSDSTMIFCRAGLEYRCSGIEVEKAGVKATIELREGEAVLYKDRLGLAMANRRKGFARECVAQRAGLLYESIVNDLAQLDDLIKLKEKEVFAALEDEKSATQYVMSAEEESKALELLRSPRLFWQVKQMLDRIGVVGEETNKLVIYLGYTSRLLSEPIQILVKGESSSGKSYVTRKTLTLFPRECFTELTDMTPQALFYIKEKDLRHHILLVFEKHGGEKADYTIRTTQSEGVLRIWVVTKDKETNEMTTKEVTVQGPIMFLLTTTDAMIHAENETRNISLFSDDSKDQTAAIRSMAVKQYLLEAEEIDQDELLAWHNAQRLLQPYQVRIPFIAEIDARFPLEPVRVRRDFHRFIALLQTVALLHQHQRPVTEIKGKLTIDTTVGDYYIAKKLAEKIFAQAIIELGPKSIEVWRYCEINRFQADGVTPNVFTYAWVAEGMGWKTATVKKWAYPLANAGYIRWVMGDGEGKNTGGKGRTTRWELTDKTYHDMNVLPDASDLVARYPALSGEIYDPLTGVTPDDVLPF